MRAIVGATTHHLLGPEHVEVLRLGRHVSVRAALERLHGDPRVASAQPNRIYSIEARPSDPLFKYQWGLQNTGQSGGSVDADIDAPEAWDRLGTSTPFAVGNFAVGVIDTGVDTAHEDLVGKLAGCVRATAGVVTPGCTDDNGHGTHVAGIVAAAADNGKGISGTAPQARVYACKALNSAGSGADADIVTCINDLMKHRSAAGIHVISMSLGGDPVPPGEPDVLKAAVDKASASGMLVVAAAGNEGSTSESGTEYPAGYANVVSVAATDRHDQRASFSNANSDVEIAAPGVSILSTVPTYPTGVKDQATGKLTGGDWDPTGYAYLSGTSMATPEVAGVAALVASQTGKTGASLRNALDSSADDLGPAGRDHEFGFGRVNACRALGGSCGYRGASALRLPITRSFRPTGVRVLAGGYYARRSSVRRLYFNDGSRLELNARRSGSSWLSDLYSGTPIGSSARSTLRRLQVTFNGNVSASAGLRLSVYDWSARRWTSIKLWRRAATSDRSFTWASSSGARRYASVSGQVRLRVTGRRAHSFRTRTDLVRVTATY